MKKLLFLLLALSLTRMGIAYADTNQPITVRNFFLGATPTSDSNLNQILALLVGPQGAPGPAGVAGRDGFIGMNGQDGKDGLPGAPGLVGPRGATGAQGPAGATGAQGPAGATGAQGPAGAAGVVGTTVVAMVVAEGSSECGGLGGSKFVTGTTTTYACNGSGGSGGTTFTFGQGRVQIGTCDANAEVGFTFPTRWSGEDFFLNKVTVTGVDGHCIGATLKLYFKIKSSGTIYITSSGYGLGDNVVCSYPLRDSEPGLASNPGTRTDNVFTIDASTSCSHTDAASNPLPNIDLGALGTRDLGNWVGFEIA